MILLLVFFAEHALGDNRMAHTVLFADDHHRLLNHLCMSAQGAAAVLFCGGVSHLLSPEYSIILLSVEHVEYWHLSLSSLHVPSLNLSSMQRAV